jgi:hypothetical protein
MEQKNQEKKKRIPLSRIASQYLRPSILDPFTMLQNHMAQNLMKKFTKNGKDKK